MTFWIGRQSGDWKHLLPGRHFRAGMLGRKAGLVSRAVVAPFSHEAWAAPPGQLGYCLVSNLVFGSEEGAVPFQERGGREKRQFREATLTSSNREEQGHRSCWVWEFQAHGKAWLRPMCCTCRPRPASSKSSCCTIAQCSITVPVQGHSSLTGTPKTRAHPLQDRTTRCRCDSTW